MSQGKKITSKEMIERLKEIQAALNQFVLDCEEHILLDEVPPNGKIKGIQLDIFETKSDDKEWR